MSANSIEPTSNKNRELIFISCTGTKLTFYIFWRRYTCQHIWLSSPSLIFFSFIRFLSSSIRDNRRYFAADSSPESGTLEVTRRIESLYLFSFGDALEVRLISGQSKSHLVSVKYRSILIPSVIFFIAVDLRSHSFDSIVSPSWYLFWNIMVRLFNLVPVSSFCFIELEAWITNSNALIIACCNSMRLIWFHG